jgi:hypothetical protein
LLAHVEGVPLLRRLVAPGVRRLAADSLLGEVAVPVDAAETLGLSPRVALVRTPRAAGPSLAMGALVGLVEEEGGDVERTSAGAAL